MMKSELDESVTVQMVLNEAKQMVRKTKLALQSSLDWPRGGIPKNNYLFIYQNLLQNNNLNGEAD